MNYIRLENIVFDLIGWLISPFLLILNSCAKLTQSGAFNENRRDYLVVGEDIPALHRGPIMWAVTGRRVLSRLPDPPTPWRAARSRALLCVSPPYPRMKYPRLDKYHLSLRTLFNMSLPAEYIGRLEIRYLPDPSVSYIQNGFRRNIYILSIVFIKYRIFRGVLNLFVTFLIMIRG